MVAIWKKDDKTFTKEIDEGKETFEEQFSLHEAFLESVPQTLVLTYLIVVVSDGRNPEDKYDINSLTYTLISLLL